MKDAQSRVKFEPNGRVVYALRGTKVLEAAAQAGVIVDTPCGSAGVCGKCRVRVTAGACPPTAEDEKVFSAEALEAGWRLACQTGVCGEEETVVYVPETSVFAGSHQILETSSTQTVAQVKSSVRKVYVELPPPSLQDDLADLPRLERVVGQCEVEMGLLRKLPALLREDGFKGTAVLSGQRLVDFEHGDTTEHCYSVAFDVGTTTVVATLLDARDGTEMAVASRMNPQVSFGDDVLSRIVHASANPEGLAELNGALIEEIDGILEELCTASGIARNQIYLLAFAGNTTMENLLCGIDPKQLGVVPFVPAYERGILRTADEFNIPIHPRGDVYVFPVIGGFVGGDTVACMLATRLADSDGAALMIDVGTNGEIVLTHQGRIFAASTAAGPAFEGARISCGMRATRGAIEKVLIDEDFHCSVIDNAEPKGLCGSGLIDLCAQLLKKGIISRDGRLLPPDELPDEVSDALRARVRCDGTGEVSFVLGEDPGDGPNGAVALIQQDVRELQLASGAIRAGIAILLKNAGLQAEDLEQVLIAGGFGSFIRRSNAQRIGLLPACIDHRLIDYVGNASLGGAKWAALSSESRDRAEELARRTEHVELSNDEDFAMEFAMAMQFPGDG